MSDWYDTAEGPAAVAERDQFEAELADVVRASKLLFVIAAPLNESGPDIVVRALYALSDEVGSDVRQEAVATFLMVARDELDKAINELGETL